MFSKETYVQRRALLKKSLGSGILLFLGNDDMGLNSEDNTFRYRQDSSFLYYFGLSFAGLSAVIDIDNDKVEKGIASTYMNDYIIYDNDVISNKYIALTFDDGPNYNTNKVLDILEENNVPATFFVLGNRIKGNENILKRMVSSKMEIGNHTFNHLLLTKYKEDKVESEINNTSNLIFDVTGKYPTLFRPSYGSCNKMIKRIVDTPIIIWDIDTLDWKYHNSRRISSRVINKVKDGDIVLMHDIYSATANALEIIIPSLKSKGYTFVTVSDLFYYKNIPLEKGKVYGFAR